jgi:hypothetical protein
MNIKVLAQAQTQNNLSDGCGPAYLLNGLTDNDYWYQVGISYNYDCSNNTISVNSSGFKMVYELYDPQGNIVDLGSGNSGSSNNFSKGIVKNNDIINLNISIVGQNIILYAHDSNGAYNSVNISSYGSKYFVVTPYFVIGKKNYVYFTGLMTEWACSNDHLSFKPRSVYYIEYPKTPTLTFNTVEGGGTLALGEVNSIGISYNSNYSIIINNTITC